MPSAARKNAREYWQPWDTVNRATTSEVNICSFIPPALPSVQRSGIKPDAARDALLLRVIGSPDPYGRQIDGMGGATSSTSKTVIIARSGHAGHDVDYLFGQVSIECACVDWSGNCGNLAAANGASPGSS